MGNKMHPANNSTDIANKWIGYDDRQAVKSAMDTLNRAIEDLTHDNLNSGIEKMQKVTDMLVTMNEYYDQNFVIAVEQDGSKIFQGTLIGFSACLSYGWNRRNIVVLVDCKRLLNLPNRDLPFVVEVLRGCGLELPNGVKH